MKSKTRIRIVLTDLLAFGPGKAELLLKIGETGSVQAAAAAMGMSYMKSWKMIKLLNVSFQEPLVIMHRGGKSQGGAELTPMGRKIVALYQEAVASAEAAMADPLSRIEALLVAG